MSMSLLHKAGQAADVYTRSFCQDVEVANKVYKSNR
jgi:hypothetical protein